MVAFIAEPVAESATACRWKIGDDPILERLTHRPVQQSERDGAKQDHAEPVEYGAHAGAVHAHCDGRKRVVRERELSVTIPAGVDDGMQLRLSNEGEPGTRGGPPGDLYVVLRVQPHEIFERHGDDVVCRLDLTITQAALGDEMNVPT